MRASRLYSQYSPSSTCPSFGFRFVGGVRSTRMQLPQEMWHMLLWNWFGMALLTAALVLIRLDQEEAGRKVQAMRRLSQFAYRS